MSLTYGEFCAGYGGLGLAVEEVFDAELSWYFEFDAAPSKIMARHWPGLPNHGDMTTADWATLPYVDILSGGTPCQDLSGAGARKGMTEGTRSNLWVQMRDAIATIQPQYVVWENVRGAYSAKADSEMEPCSGCLGAGGGDGESVLRALGRVLGDFSDLGYDAEWRGLRAADVGAPHGRYRVFILATRRGSGLGATAHSDDRGGQESVHRNLGQGSARQGATALLDAPNIRLAAVEDTDLATSYQRREPAPGQEESGRVWPNTGGRGGAPVANASGATIGEHPGGPSEEEARTETSNGPGHPGGEQHDQDTREIVADADCGDDSGREQDQEWGTLGRTPAQRGSRSGSSGGTEWGDYTPAIHRWEASRGTAPAPTELTAKGKHRLSAEFASWMMGLPAGWITDTPGLSRNDQLKAAGNGVVPQQAAAALRHMLAASQAAQAQEAAA